MLYKRILKDFVSLLVDERFVNKEDILLYELAFSEYLDGKVEIKIYLNFGVFLSNIQCAKFLFFLNLNGLNISKQSLFLIKKINIILSLFPQLNITIGYIPGKEGVFKIFIDQLWKLSKKNKQMILKILSFDFSITNKELVSITHLSLDGFIKNQEIDFKNGKNIKIYFSRNYKNDKKLNDCFIFKKIKNLFSEYDYHIMHRYDNSFIPKGVKVYFDFKKASSIISLLNLLDKNGYKFDKIKKKLLLNGHKFNKHLEYGGIDFKFIDSSCFINKFDIYLYFKKSDIIGGNTY